jgi:hypothetical protein
MKYTIFLSKVPARHVRPEILVLVLGLLSSCGRPLPETYFPALPPLPPAWNEILGEARWRLEWVNRTGGRESLDIGPGEAPGLELVEEGITPLLAWPYWPNRDIRAGVMKPAGAIFPYDAAGDRIRLNWRGGVEANLYWELAAGLQTEESPWGKGSVPRQPQYFDWPRFRELLQSDSLAPELREDPWLADWKTSARRILESGFDRRRITALPRETLAIPLGDGQGALWIGASPFARAREPGPGGILPLEISGSVETWFSARGMIRCSTGGLWIYRPWDP